MATGEPVSESSYDVYVHEGHLVEVHRGEHGTVARIYGADWETQPVVSFHPPATAPATAPEPQIEPVYMPVGNHSGFGFAVMAFVIATFFCAWLVLR